MDKHKLAIKWFNEACKFDKLKPNSDKAIDAYKRSLKHDDQYTDSYINLGFIYVARDDFAEAAKYFQKALELEPDNHEAINNLGYVYEKMGRFGSAKGIYERALKLHPENVETIINIGKVLELEGNFHAAVNQYQNAIKEEPASVSARFCLGFLYDRHDMFDEAIAAYIGVLERDNTHIKTLFNLVNLYEQLGNDVKSIEYIKRMIDLIPGNVEIWNKLGSIYQNISNYKEATVALSKSLSINPFQENAQINLAQMQFSLYLEGSNKLKKKILHAGFILSFL